MSRFPLFGTGQTGKSTHVSAQRRINVYAERRRDEDRGKISFHGRPGYTLFADLGETPIRGMDVVGDYVYAVHRGTLYQIDNAGQAVSQGTLDTTSGRVGIDNNGTEVLMVDGVEGYVYETVADTFAKVTDSDFPVADTVAFQGGRFILNNNGTGQFYLTASYDGTAVDATEFATAESFPDDLVAVFVDQGEVLLFGPESMEIWASIGAVDFPYQRIDGAVVEWGLAARWSVAKFGNTIAWLGKNRTGETQVVRLSGYVPQVISDPELEYAINSYSIVSDATALSYNSGGHTFYQLNFPTAGKSWAFDSQSGLWSELQYGTKGARHRGEISVQYLNKTLISDYETGQIYQLSADALDDNGMSFAKEITGRHVFDERSIPISRLWADFDMGVGTATGEGDDPQLMLQVSKDGGKTYGPEKWASFGKIGEYLKRAIWRRLGRAYEWTFRIRSSDPVKFHLSGAWIDAE